MQRVECVREREEEEVHVIRGYRGELDLNNKQVTACLTHMGAARWAYNYVLTRKKEAFQAGLKTPYAAELHKEINRLKSSHPWMYGVSKCAFQEGLRDADEAFAHFFRKCKLKKQGRWTGMLKNRKLSRSIADVGFAEFMRQVEYKAFFAGFEVKQASRWYPSSKTCSWCGWVKEDLTLKDRVFVCQDCGLVMDRDLNAARNLELLAYTSA